MRPISRLFLHFPLVTSPLIRAVLSPKTATKLLVMQALSSLSSLFFMAMKRVDLLRKKALHSVKKKKNRAHGLGVTNIFRSGFSFLYDVREGFSKRV